MLISLHVKNLALIEEEEVYFTEGLNILTGETGAGKSIIIGSINLALGAKADKDYIRAGAEYAMVELVFVLAEDARRMVAETTELMPEEDGTLIIQRKILPSRSVCKVNGETVSAGQLKNLASLLLDIHGQHEHQSLLKPANHKEILDNYAGNSMLTAKADLKELYRQYSGICKELAQEGMEEAARLRELDLLVFEINEIETAAPAAGEDEQVEKDYHKMHNAGKIRAAVVSAYGLTGYEQENGAGESIGRALREIRGVTALDEGVLALAEQLQELDSLLNDFNRSTADYLEGLEFDQDRFRRTEDRLNTLNHLKSKYGKTIPLILAGKEAKEKRRLLLEDYEHYRQTLIADKEQLTGEILRKCQEISRRRTEAGVALAAKMQTALADLNFAQVRFAVEVSSDEEDFGADGYDRVVFMIAPNPGEVLKPLNQIASGGELSRIMLALKTVQADENAIHTLIFDEVDAGISGKTAWKVAEKLGWLGRRHQVICITHLPQIAAMADAHFVISKKMEQNRTVTSIKEIKEEASINELARLLGSDVITAAVIKNAQEMKDLAVKTKKI